MNNTMLYVIYRWIEGSSEEEPRIIGIYSSLQKADNVAQNAAREERADNEGGEVQSQINYLGFREYFFDIAHGETFHYEVSVKMLDADPNAPIPLPSVPREEVYAEPSHSLPPIQVVTASSQIVYPQVQPPQGLRSETPDELMRIRTHRSNLKNIVDATLSRLSSNIGNLIHSLPSLLTNDPWEKFKYDVLITTGISSLDPEINYAKAYVTEAAVSLFTKLHPEYFESRVLRDLSGLKSVSEYDRELEDKITRLPSFQPQVQTQIPMIPQQYPLPTGFQIPVQQAVMPSISYDVNQYRNTIERFVEQYIANELKDFKGAQEAMQQINPELNKVEIIKYRMKEFLENTFDLAYSRETDYANFYIEDRAKDFVTILDPTYMRRNWMNTLASMMAPKKKS